MKSYWVAALVVLLLALYGFACFKWGKWVEKEAWTDSDFRDTVIVHDTITAFPPATVKPNPVKVVVVKDPMQTRMVDSLIASGASKVSLIRALGSGWYAEQSWNTTKDSAYIVGRLHVYYFPPDREMDTAIMVDSVAVPARVIEIIREREVERVSWPWVCIGFGAGVILGSYAVHELHK